MFWKFYSNFLSQWFFVSFYLFFAFNLYARRLSYTEDYYASSSALFGRKVPWEFRVVMQWDIFFCRLFFLSTDSIFYFAAGISLLPWLISFCREIFSFAAEISFLPRGSFPFAGSFFLLPWPISFLARAFFFCRGSLSFAGSFFLLPWHLWATVIIKHSYLIIKLHL